MKQVLKWAGYGLAGVVAVAALAAGGAFGVSEFMIHAPVAKPRSTMMASRDAGAVARGRQIATVQGCVDCHGANLQGRMFDDLPNIATLNAPNLTLAAARQSDADLDRAIRHGVGSDGRPLWVMPSSAFAQLTDRETADLIAYLRSLPSAGAPQPRLKIHAVGRIGVLAGQFQSEPELIKVNAGRALPDLGPQYAEGRSVARACVECHGQQLEGGGPLKTPDLTIAAAYDAEDFQRLMHEGIAAGGRKTGMMPLTARIRFKALTSDEIAALQGYLKARADRQIAVNGATTLPKS